MVKPSAPGAAVGGLGCIILIPVLWLSTLMLLKRMVAPRLTTSQHRLKVRTRLRMRRIYCTMGGVRRLEASLFSLRPWLTGKAALAAVHSQALSQLILTVRCIFLLQRTSWQR